MVERSGGDITRGEAQVGQRVRGVLRELVAERDQLGAELDAGDFGAGAEVGGNREGEVAFATTHVGDADKLRVES